MKDINADWQALHDSMLDFSNVYGDQKLIECLTDWLNKHMGSKWSITHVEPHIYDNLWGINYGNEVVKND
jgi:hypothetical protein